MTTNISQQLQSYRTGLGQMPEQGPAAVDLAINFTNDNQFIKEFFQEQSRLEIDFIQAIFIDNSASATAVTVSVLNSLYNIKVAAGSQGFYPLVVPEGKATIIFTRAVAEATVLNVTFFNHLLPFITWAT